MGCINGRPVDSPLSAQPSGTVVFQVTTSFATRNPSRRDHCEIAARLLSPRPSPGNDVRIVGGPAISAAHRAQTPANHASRNTKDSAARMHRAAPRELSFRGCCRESTANVLDTFGQIQRGVVWSMTGMGRRSL